MTVRQLLASIDSAELTEWRAFETLEPFGALHEQYMAGATASAVFNAQRASQDDRFFQPYEFMPQLGEEQARRAPPPRVLSPDELAALLDAQLFGRAT